MHSARARLAVTAFAPTSTMRGWPCSSRWESSLTAGKLEPFAEGREESFREIALLGGELDEAIRGDGGGKVPRIGEGIEFGDERSAVLAEAHREGVGEGWFELEGRAEADRANRAALMLERVQVGAHVAMEADLDRHGISGKGKDGRRALPKGQRLAGTLCDPVKGWGAEEGFHHRPDVVTRSLRDTAAEQDEIAVEIRSDGFGSEPLVVGEVLVMHKLGPENCECGA